MPHRLKPLALIGLAALLLHAAVLGGLQWTWPQRADAAPAAAAMQVRFVAMEPLRPADGVVSAPNAPFTPGLVSAAVATLAKVEIAAFLAPLAPLAPLTFHPADVPHISPVARPPVARRAVAVAQPVRPTDVPVAPAAPVASVAPPAEAAPIVQVAQWSAAAPDSAPVADEIIPHYRTQVPPAALLRYELQRGGLRGSGDLLWRPDGAHYELRLDGRVGPLTVLTQVSSGGFDAAGLAPLRFTDKRLRRPTSAANFQRDAGKITFSGPATEFALHAGMQDRLSWMLQLAAIIAAEPALRHTGAKVVMGVVGAHADASVWAFRCLGPEAVETGTGSVDSIKYLREPRDPYDTTVQVWLDPMHHFLPVHATQKAGANDEGFSLRLQEIVAPP